MQEPTQTTEINTEEIHTNKVFVKNIDPSVTVEALTSFFSFTGNVKQVRLSNAEDGTQQAIIEFEQEESVSTAELMTGATLENRKITIERTTMTQSTMHDSVYQGETLPARTIPEIEPNQTKTSAVASLLAKGYVLGENTLQQAVMFDKQHKITENMRKGVMAVKDAAITVDEKLHLTEYMALGATIALSYIDHVDKKYEVTKTIEQKAEEVDQAIGFSTAVGTCKQKINEGIQVVMNSQPMQKVTSGINELDNEVNKNIEIERSKQPQPQMLEYKPSAPSEIEEEKKEEENQEEKKEETEPKQEEKPTTQPDLIDLN